MLLRNSLEKVRQTLLFARDSVRLANRDACRKSVSLAYAGLIVPLTADAPEPTDLLNSTAGVRQLPVETLDEQ